MVDTMTEAELAELDDPAAPNVPARMPGHQGPQAIVTVDVQRDRRAAMSSLMSQGVSTDGLLSAFSSNFGMTESATRALITEVRAMWDDDDAEAARYARGAAKRRLHRHIQSASKDRKWTAVANLEGVLASVEGTDVQEEDKPIDTNARLTEALLGLLGETDTKDVRIMIEKERMYIELSGRDGTVQHKQIEAGEVVVETRGG